MSHSDSDQRGGHPVRHPSMRDCLCCPSLSRADYTPTRAVQRRVAIEEQIAEPVEYEGDLVLHDGGHLFDGGRCVHCHTNVYDIGIHPAAPVTCPIPRKPLRYTTESAAGRR